jgi:hypothetical protein
MVNKKPGSVCTTARQRFELTNKQSENCHFLTQKPKLCNYVHFAKG